MTLPLAPHALAGGVIDRPHYHPRLVEIAQKLDFDLRFDKLGLDRDLKSMERLEKDHQLAELQVIAPTLERISNDNGIMNIARQRARRLLDQSRPEAAGANK